MPEDTPQLLPGTLYLLILRTLAASPLQLYPALNRMLLKGWLRAEWGTSETNRKVRVYRLTKDGQRQLTAEAGEFNKLVNAIRPVLKTA